MKRLFFQFLYELKSAWRGITRNWALSLSALGAVTVSLFLIACFSLIGYHTEQFASRAESGLRLHAVLAQGLDPAAVEQTGNDIRGLSFVDRADFSDKDQELELMIQEKGEAFSVYRGEQNPLSDAWFVYLDNGTDIQEAARQVGLIPGVETVTYGGESTVELARLLSRVRIAGSIGSALLLVLSMYLIYNTIRTTIYSRQDEIITMRQVGASNAFIKIPFELQGMVLGLLGAVIPFVLIAWGYPRLYNGLGGILFANVFELMKPGQTVFWSGLLLFGGGLLVGWLASFMAATKYIKAKR